MRQVLTLIPAGGAPADVSLSEPGAAFGEAVRLNFAQPAAAPFRVRRVAAPDGGAPTVEVQQAHPRGVGWGTLEFPVDRLPAGARIRFEARLLPARQVVLAVYAPDVNVTVATFDVSHRVTGFEAVVSESLAAQLAGAGWIRLGLTLPQGTWFILQLTGATVDMAVEKVV